MNTVQFFAGLLDWLLADPSHIVTAAAALAAATPTPDPATPLGKAYKIVDLFALNFLHAKETGAVTNAGEPGSPAAGAPLPPLGGALKSLAVLALLGLGLSLAACGGNALAPNAATPAAASTTSVFEIRAGYDAAVLAPMAAYAQLPSCPAAGAAAPAAGTPPATPICADPAVLAQLQKADTAAKAALDAAENTVRTAPNMDASTAIAAATNAVAAAQTILSTYNIH